MFKSFITLNLSPTMAGFIKYSGSFENWNVYKKAVIICDVTERFIRRAFIPPNRTIDQMRQAARSCKQNIVEGISDKTVSVEMCLKLLGIARGSVRELLEDYGDFVRQNDLKTWPADDERTLKTRRYCIKYDDATTFVAKCRERNNETVANIMMTQIRQLDSMLTGVMRQIEGEFISEGGIREAMTKARKQNRGF